jgi:CheY-like chemotaxis protein
MNKAEAPAKSFRVLLVEDEPIIRELVQNLLGEGVEVVSAANGVEGLKLARSLQFQLILLDIVLPQMDGITLCRVLKSDHSTSSVPLYMLTAKASKSDVDAAIRAGADGYIQKPFRSDDLLTLIDRLRKTP